MSVAEVPDVGGVEGGPASVGGPVGRVRGDGGAGGVGLESIEGRCQRLEGRAQELMGALNVLSAELVGLVGEVEEHGIGNWWGIRSISHWLTWRCGLSPAHARRLVQISRRMDDLPAAAAAFRAGELSEDQMKVIADKCPAERDGEVTEMARKLLVPQLQRLLAHVPTCEAPVPEPVRPHQPAPDTTDTVEPDTGEEASRSGRPVVERREVVFGTSEDGRSWTATLVLPADEGALVELSWQRGRDAAFTDTDSDSPVSWADGVLRAAETALEGLDRGTAEGRRPAHRHQVIYHLPLNHPDGDGRAVPAGSAHVHGAGALPQWLMRYLECDCTRRWILEAGGKPVAVSSRSDAVDPVLRSVIEERDRICRVPGCGQRRWLHIHHIVHRHDGGPTEPDNLVALCPGHHRDHHKGLLGITGDPARPDGLHFSDKWGRPILEPVPPRPPPQPPTDIDHTWQPPLGEQLNARDFIWRTTPTTPKRAPP